MADFYGDAEGDDRQARPGAAAVGVEVLLLLLAAGTFVLLYDVRRHDAGYWMGSVSESLDDSTGVAILLGLLVLFLLAAILLLILGFRRRAAAVDEVAWDAGTKAETAPAAPDYSFDANAAPEPVPAPESDDRPMLDLTLGCRACGTVFQHRGREGDGFACTNCGRPGIVKSQQPVLVDLPDVTCPHCGHGFRRYLSHAECPSCHRAVDA